MSRRCAAIVMLCLAAHAACADEPALPEEDGQFEIDAQEWPLRPGPRTVTVYVHYPTTRLSGVNAQTGLFLSLHNWGGTKFAGAPDPGPLVKRYNVVAIGLDYLQSGPVDGPEPYDFGYLQALDALRALHFVREALRNRGTPPAAGRIYATGGSGGGNVALMANKLAPRTFAVVVDLCGMARLTDDIAFDLPGGSELNAHYRHDAADPYYLSPSAQALRDVGRPNHLRTMLELGNSCRVVVVHGTDDHICPIEDAREMVANMRQAGLAVEPHFVAASDVDGRAFTSTGHALGNRTEIVFRVADAYLLPDGPQAIVREGPTDFDLRDSPVRYAAPGGTYVICYEQGFPVGRFEGR
jgi:predicted esterase